MGMVVPMPVAMPMMEVVAMMVGMGMVRPGLSFGNQPDLLDHSVRYPMLF